MKSRRIFIIITVAPESTAIHADVGLHRLNYCIFCCKILLKRYILNILLISRLVHIKPVSVPPVPGVLLCWGVLWSFSPPYSGRLLCGGQAAPAWEKSLWRCAANPRALWDCGSFTHVKAQHWDAGYQPWGLRASSWLNSMRETLTGKVFHNSGKSVLCIAVYRVQSQNTEIQSHISRISMVSFRVLQTLMLCGTDWKNKATQLPANTHPEGKFEQVCWKAMFP